MAKQRRSSASLAVLLALFTFASLLLSLHCVLADSHFEGLPIEQASPEMSKISDDPKPLVQIPSPEAAEEKTVPPTLKSFPIEIICGSLLIIIGINYFIGKRENKTIALEWTLADSDSIFDRIFRLLGVSEGDDSPLLVKEGPNVLMFYASAGQYCKGLLATMELKSRHCLVSRIYNFVVRSRDEISFEVYMKNDAMDKVAFAVVKKKAAKRMQKELRDLLTDATLMAPANGRKWVSEELSVISESKEVAGDLISEAVLDQVFGEKAYEKFGKNFISLLFCDGYRGMNKKTLLFKFALPDAKNMADMTRLVSLIPYYIDFIGRYKLSAQAQSEIYGARAKPTQEAYVEMYNFVQAVEQRKERERKAKERARQM